MSAVAPQVKERPIIFGAESVKAILEGRKTQTRRVIKGLPPGVKCGGGLPESDYQYRFTADFKSHVDLRCPYGRPWPYCERLWVREALIKCQDSELSIPLALYKSGRQQVLCYGEPAEWNWRGETLSPIHMPRWASRLTLAITDVRVERLQEIGEQKLSKAIEATKETGRIYEAGNEWHAQQHFREMWDALNAKRGFGWDSNPFVWVIEFRKT